MSQAAIRVEGLGKMYRIGGPVERYKTFRDAVAQSVAGAGRRVKGLFGRSNGAAPKYETIWALKDVSFEIEPGEVVGVIGRNGAGKSTLLKILSRITEPTEGRVEIRGRVGSLLEVGTGFHPELTGRENVYLNGAILGMRRAEVDRKFDEIVAFAEIEKFIDTPVKHYSSGMYVRLAFSVAAHLEPQILLVDEVLAVGDFSFQGKCIGKMNEVAGQGRTVLFVSHQISAIEALCRRVLLLERGGLLGDTETQQGLAVYFRHGGVNCSGDVRERNDRKGMGALRLVMVRAVGPNGESELWISGKAASLCFEIEGDGRDVQCAFTIYDSLGRPVGHCSTRYRRTDDAFDGCAVKSLAWECRELPLLPGIYRLNVALYAGTVLQDHVEAAISVEVQAGVCFGRMLGARQAGAVALDYRWIKVR